jgi:hypothetical protein
MGTCKQHPNAAFKIIKLWSWRAKPIAQVSRPISPCAMEGPARFRGAGAFGPEKLLGSDPARAPLLRRYFFEQHLRHLLSSNKIRRHQLLTRRVDSA